MTVLAVEGDTVRIGISAPKQIDIFRKEVYASIQEANRESAKPDAPSVAAFMELLQGIENKNKNIPIYYKKFFTSCRYIV